MRPPLPVRLPRDAARCSAASGACRQDAAALAELYAAGSTAAQTLDEQCFLTTQAYIFALESNHPLAEQLHAFLVQNRRDA